MHLYMCAYHINLSPYFRIIRARMQLRLVVPLDQFDGAGSVQHGRLWQGC